MTDGKWIWPRDVIYYVRNYDLQLSSEFIDYMRSQNWVVSDKIEIDYDNLEIC